MRDNIFLFSDTLEGLRPDTSLSILLPVMIFRTTLGFGFNLSGVTLFDDLNREDFG